MSTPNIDEILTEALDEVCDKTTGDIDNFYGGYGKEIIESIKERLAENDLAIVDLNRI